MRNKSFESIIGKSVRVAAGPEPAKRRRAPPIRPGARLWRGGNAHERHGLRKIPEYGVWVDMWYRCANPNCRAFKNYGARGITVCDRWLSFGNFITDMGRRPTPKHWIERSNNNAGYTPENCKWATATEQQRNRRNNRLLTFNGETLNCSQWSVRIGISRAGIRSRLKKGWSVAQTLSTAFIPQRDRKPMNTFRALKT